MPKQLTQVEAKAIAQKLRAEVEEGRRHTIAKVRVEGIHLGQFGILRGSKAQGHGFIPSQIHVSRKDAWRLAECPMKYEEYVEKMRSDGRLPPASVGLESD